MSKKKGVKMDLGSFLGDAALANTTGLATAPKPREDRERERERRRGRFDDDEPSEADFTGNWRSGGGLPTQQDDGPMMGGPIPDTVNWRDAGPAVDEHEPEPAFRADADSNWRRTDAPAFEEEREPAPFRADADSDWRRKEAAEITADKPEPFRADADSDWRRKDAVEVAPEEPPVRRAAEASTWRRGGEAPAPEEDSTPAPRFGRASGGWRERMAAAGGEDAPAPRRFGGRDDGGRFGGRDRDDGGRFGGRDRDDGGRFGGRDRDDGGRFGGRDRDDGGRFGGRDRDDRPSSFGGRFGSRRDEPREDGPGFGARPERSVPAAFSGGRRRDEERPERSMPSAFGGPRRGQDGDEPSGRGFGRDRPPFGGGREDRPSAFGGGREDRSSAFGGRRDDDRPGMFSGGRRAGGRFGGPPSGHNILDGPQQALPSGPGRTPGSYMPPGARRAAEAAHSRPGPRAAPGGSSGVAEAPGSAPKKDLGPSSLKSGAAADASMARSTFRRNTQRIVDDFLADVSLNAVQAALADITAMEVPQCHAEVAACVVQSVVGMEEGGLRSKLTEFLAGARKPWKSGPGKKGKNKPRVVTDEQLVEGLETLPSDASPEAVERYANLVNALLTGDVLSVDQLTPAIKDHLDSLPSESKEELSADGVASAAVASGAKGKDLAQSLFESMKDFDKKDAAAAVMRAVLEVSAPLTKAAPWTSPNEYGLVLAVFMQEAPAAVAALNVLQANLHALGFPKGLIEAIFHNMYNNDVAEEDAFTEWRDNVDDSVPGKLDALRQLNRWFEWLEEDDDSEEEDSEED